MKNLGELELYDFHDSLLESIDYDRKNNKINIEVDFCCWKQAEHKENDDKTAIIVLCFENVLYANIPDVTLNSDEIIEFSLIENNTTLKIVAFNDIDNISYEIIIKADIVKIVKL